MKGASMQEMTAGAPSDVEQDLDLWTVQDHGHRQAALDLLHSVLLCWIRSLIQTSRSRRGILLLCQYLKVSDLLRQAPTRTGFGSVILECMETPCARGIPLWQLVTTILQAVFHRDRIEYHTKVNCEEGMTDRLSALSRNWRIDILIKTNILRCQDTMSTLMYLRKGIPIEWMNSVLATLRFQNLEVSLISNTDNTPIEGVGVKNTFGLLREAIGLRTTITNSEILTEPMPMLSTTAMAYESML
jgi:hypothetical protein